MLRNTLIALTLLLAASAVAPAGAHPQRRQVDRWSWIGAVGTHAHDANDYIPVATNERYARLELRATGRTIGIDHIRVKFADGRTFDAAARTRLADGQRMLIDIPSHSPVNMVIVEYANQAPYWRDRETSRLEVRGLAADVRRGRVERRVDDDRRVVPAPRHR